MSRLRPAPQLTAEALQAAAKQNAGATQQQQQRSRSSSHGSHDSSHSSHSSHQERQREQHLGEAPGGPPGVAKPVAAAAAILLFLFAAQAIGFWLFTKGFLLTRTTLDGVTSSCASTASTTWSLPLPTHSGRMESDEDYDAWEHALTRSAECTLPARYSRSLIWIIDALRYDFIADVDDRNVQSNATTWLPNEHYHGVLNLPAQLDRQDDSFSLLAHFLADAPTTTLQRLKGLTTGSLPTFIDAGSNFGGSQITEDNWLAQMRTKAEGDAQSAKMGLMGDDTWLTVFPNAFDEEWRFPFDSFNVEDLDGVDRGVEQTLETFLEARSDDVRSEWRLLIAHTLGVDHVGHRLGASHPRMQSKLVEMQTLLQHIVDRLPDDALLVLMGDHGMDDKGDHGGDGELEVGAGLWMYSKRRPKARIPVDTREAIMKSSQALLQSHRPFSLLPSPPFTAQGHRSIPQIDFVPTISLLLGLPIPFNNLGSVIPEAFETTDMLLRALRINAFQIRHYLARYAEASSDLQPFQSDLTAAWREALSADARLAASARKEKEQSTQDAAQAYLYFNRLALVRASSVWAKFESVKMLVGLVLIAMSISVLLRFKRVADNDDVEALCAFMWHGSRMGLFVGTAFGLASKLVSLYVQPMPLFQTLSMLESIGVGAAFGAQVALHTATSTSRHLHEGEGDDNDENVAASHGSSWSWLGGIVLPILHSIVFSSNSFTVWEDKVVSALITAAMLFRGVQGYFGAPTARFKLRMPVMALAATISVRLMGLSRVCREEQAPYCTTTFYVQAQSTLSSPWVIAVAYGCALSIPTLLQKALHVSRSDAGVAPLFFTWMLRPALLAGAGYWFVDWLVTADVLQQANHSASSTTAVMEMAKLALARFDFALICAIALAFWVFSPLLIDLTQEKIEPGLGDAAAAGITKGTAADKPAMRIVVLGFANSLGSSYLLLVSLVFALHFLVAQPAGQVALSLALLVIVACAELGDHERDVLLVQRSLLGKSAAAKDTVTNPSALQTALPVSTLETSVLALLGFVVFFASGHQATFASIQWRSAFVGFRTVHGVFSPLLVILNSFGPLALLPSIALPLLVLWNLAPKPRGGPKPTAVAAATTSSSNAAAANSTRRQHGQRMPTVMHILQASMSFALYHLIVALAAAVFAAHFRRHLMLFKIWAPRFMLGVASVQFTFLGLLIGLVGAGNVMSKVSVTFGSMF